MINENNKIKKAFHMPNAKALIVFLTAGDPDADSCVKFILEMERAGADLIEIGIPFSDPIAEDEIVQASNIRVIKRGMTTDGVFDIVKRVREHSQIPLCLKSYLNPVFHYGYERFFEKCGELSVDGIIIPDLPYEERAEVEEPANRHNVALIPMLAPASEERIERIAKNTDGYIYVTGSKEAVPSLVESIRRATAVPCAIGAGIAAPKQAEQMASFSEGCILESAAVKIIEEYGKEAAPRLYEFVKNMKEAVSAINL